MVRFLKPADYTSMPWKNGGGRTTEIATFPPGAALDAFAWRVSVADVAGDGPFSRFPGVDRTIVLLNGAGMRLAVGRVETDLRTPFEPFRFSGDDAVECTLIAGPVRDFNAMFRRGEAHGTVTVVRGDGARIAPRDFLLVYAAAGAHECAIPGHPSHVLDAGHAALIERTPGEESPAFAIAPAGPTAVAIVVSVDIR